jgi:hypothetical protein
MAVQRLKNSSTNGKSSTSGGMLIQLNFVGLTVFSVALIATSVLITYSLVANRPGHQLKPVDNGRDEFQALAGAAPIKEQKEPPPWGQFISRDIDLEQPEEYVAYQLNETTVEKWTFEGMTPDQVRSLMQSSGVAAGEIARALSPALMSVAGSDTVITPDDKLVFSLQPKTRAKLYAVLAKSETNRFMHFPYCFVGRDFEAKFADGQVRSSVVASLKQLLYPRDGNDYFSDLGILLQQVPDKDERLRLLKILSRQSAVIVRVRIWPDTDIDKLIGYWGRGLQVKDVRPLLESFKRLPDGTSMSILYFLPQFARQRLYTFPQPSSAGDPVGDCHWSTLNFFNDVPDNRLADPKFATAYVKANYYEIGKPTAYGDLIFLLNKSGNAIHSAVFLADDLVFTKNGSNFVQPWMLMHLKDLLAEYSVEEQLRLVAYRNKKW